MKKFDFDAFRLGRVNASKSKLKDSAEIFENSGMDHKEDKHDYGAIDVFYK